MNSNFFLFSSLVFQGLFSTKFLRGLLCVYSAYKSTNNLKEFLSFKSQPSWKPWSIFDLPFHGPVSLTLWWVLPLSCKLENTLREKGNLLIKFYASFLSRVILLKLYMGCLISILKKKKKYFPKLLYFSALGSQT